MIGLVCCLVAGVHGQTDPIQIFDGVWVSVTPPGPHVVFNTIALGQREASLPNLGQARINLSNGEDGSNFRISGPGFNCFYLILTTNQRKRMVWDLKSGSDACFKSAAFDLADNPSQASNPVNSSAPQVTQSGVSAATVDGTTNLWMHNGSRLRLLANGASRKFVYETPRSAMQAVGVKANDVLFIGTKAQKRYFGTAYIFHRACSPQPYSVEGFVLDDDRKVVMTGKAPVLTDGCNVSRYVDDVLTFVYAGP